MQEKLVNTKGLIRSRKSKKNIQYNWGNEKKRKHIFTKHYTEN